MTDNTAAPAPRQRGAGCVGPRMFRTGGPGEAIVCILLTAAIAAYHYRGVLAAYLQGVIT